MPRLLLTKILRDLWLNKARSALVIIAVAVGVAVYGVMATGEFILQRDLSGAYLASQPADAILRVDGADRVLLARLRQSEHVQAVEGRRIVAGKVETPSGWTTIEMHGMTEGALPTIHQLALAPGAALPDAAGDILLERSATAVIAAETGQPITVRLADGSEHELVVTGLANDLAPIPSSIDPTVYSYIFPATLAALGLPDEPNTLYLVTTAAPKTQAAVETAVTAIVAEIEQAGYQVVQARIPEPQRPRLADNLEGGMAVLRILGQLCLVLSAFLVVSVMSGLVAGQIGQIGVMKAVGARTWQILVMYLTMVLLVGLLALLLALPLSLAGAYLMAHFTAQTMDFDINGLTLSWRVVAVQAASALLLPVLAALLPISAGARRTVKEAISLAGVESRGAGGAVWLKSASVLTALGVRNVFRRRLRLSLGTLALGLAGAMFISVFGTRIALQQALTKLQAEWNYDVSIALTAMHPAAELRDAALATPGVVAAEAWGMVDGRSFFTDDRLSGSLTVIGVPIDTQFTKPDIRAGRWLRPEEPATIFLNGDAVRQVARSGLGEMLRLRFASGDRDYRVVGSGARMFSPAAYVAYTDFESLISAPGLANWVVVRTATGTASGQASIEAALVDEFARRGLEVARTDTSARRRQTTSAQLQTIVVLLLVMALLIAAVGGMGLATTLSLNLLERRREIGVLRAIGARNSAIRRLILAEALAMATIGYVISLLLMLPISLALGNKLGASILYRPLDFVFSGLGLLLWIILIFFIALFASLAPAQNAVRMAVNETLSFE